ncbi:MAG: hypothetical protein ACFCUS_13520 [Rubrimonas sp.]
MRGTVLLTLGAVVFIGLNAMTLVGHFAATYTSAPRGSTAPIGFAELDRDGFDHAVAAGAPVIVSVVAPGGRDRAAHAPSGAIHVALDPSACPGVAAALDAWKSGAVVVFADGAELGRMGADGPDYAVEALLRRLRDVTHKPSRGAGVPSDEAP